MQTGECPKRQTVSFRTAVGLHGVHTTHDQNAFAVKACETFLIQSVKSFSQPCIEKNSSILDHGTFIKKSKHDKTQRLRGLQPKTASLSEQKARAEVAARSHLHNFFCDDFTFFANSPLPNFLDISICNKSDLIIAFDSSARDVLTLAGN
jgi:hypothetical protein